MSQQLDKVSAYYLEGFPDLCEKLALTTDDRWDEVELSVRQEFKRGVNSAFQQSAIEFLEKNFSSQQAIAEELAFKDRTSISKIKSAGQIDGPTLTLLLTSFPDFTPPTQRRAFATGYAAAISHLQTQVAPEVDVEPLTPDQFEALLGLLASTEWLEASHRGNHGVKESAQKKVLQQLGQEMDGELSAKFLRLMQLVQTWIEYVVVCLEMIPTTGGQADAR